MSAYDDDPYGQPYPGTEPTPGAPNLQDQGLKDAVTRFYQTLLGRAPENDDVVNQWIQGLQGNLYAIQEAIKATPEAKAYAAKPKADPVTPNPTPEPTPTLTSAPPPVAGAPPPGPTSVGTQAAPPSAGEGGGPYTPPPAYEPPPAFSYGDFMAPTKDDVLNDEGYKSLFNSGIQAIGAKNAALGTLNTGGTIRDFMGFGQDLASRSYGDIFNRKLTEYQTNRGNAFENWQANGGVGKDAYEINYGTRYRDPWAFGQQAAGLQQNNNQFNASLGQNNNQFNSNLDWQKFLQQYKSTVTDPFEQKYRILGLL